MSTKLLVAWLAAVAAVLLACLLPRFSTPSLAEGVRQLADGDLDGRERTRTMRALLPEALAGGGRRERLLAAAFALALDDPDAWARACGAADAPPPVEAGDATLLREVDLGMPLLRTLFAARLAEVTGDVESARRRYRQAEAQAKLAFAGLAEIVAAAGRKRL